MCTFSKLIAVVTLLTVGALPVLETKAGWFANRRAARQQLRSQGRLGIAIFPQRRLVVTNRRANRRQARAMRYSNASVRSSAVGCGDYSEVIQTQTRVQQYQYIPVPQAAPAVEAKPIQVQPTARKSDQQLYSLADHPGIVFKRLPVTYANCQNDPSVP